MRVQTLYVFINLYMVHSLLENYQL